MSNKDNAVSQKQIGHRTIKDFRATERTSASSKNRTNYRVQKFPPMTVTTRPYSVRTELGEADDQAVDDVPVVLDPQVQDQSEPQIAEADSAEEQHSQVPNKIPFFEGVNAAISNCADAGVMFFGAINQTAQALLPSYNLYILMITGGRPAIDIVLAHPDFASRARAPRLDNPALMAVLLAASPKTKRQSKWCSDWANMLIAAAHCGVQVENFAD